MVAGQHYGEGVIENGPHPGLPQDDGKLFLQHHMTVKTEYILNISAIYAVVTSVGIYMAANAMN